MCDSAPRARTVLSAHLDPRPGPAPVRAARWVHYLVAELLGGLVPQPSLTDLVVRRTADDVEVLKLPAGDLPASEQLLHYVKRQLQS